MVWKKRSFVALGLWVSACCGQEGVVLRDLTRSAERRVVDFDASGVRLDNGERVAWRKILTARAPEGRQEEFDRMVEQIGLPRFRLEQRLLAGDWPAAEVAAERVVEQGFLPPLTAYQVAVTRMKNELVQGDRVAAVVPLLEALRWEADLSDAERAAAISYAPRISETELIPPELIPIWFDPEGVLAAWQIRSRDAEQENANPTATSLVFDTSLALTAGDLVAARMRLDRLESILGRDHEWVVLLRSQAMLLEGQRGAAMAELDTMREGEWSATARVARWWWLGQAWEQMGEEQDATRAALAYLQIAAAGSGVSPALIGAALYRAAAIADRQGRTDEAEILRDELLRVAPNTYHGRKISAHPTR